jgi:HipA-like protein
MAAKPRFWERVWDVIASWGGPEAIEIAAGHERAEAEVRVFLPMHDGTRVHVGSLRQDEGEYVFEYTREFKEQEQLRPISAFRELSRSYRSTKLWPFFSVRLPPLSREDVRRVIAARKIEEGDQFALLAAVGGKTIASPYELELFKPDRRSRVPAAAHPSLAVHRG